jgi:hypothetical protein
VLGVGAAGSVGVDRELHVVALLGVLGVDVDQVRAEVVLPAGVEAGLRPSAAVVVLPDR